ncbi:MAG: SPOR domain-containing protein [Candidatus Omnitrophota bacterium]
MVRGNIGHFVKSGSLAVYFLFLSLSFVYSAPDLEKLKAYFLAGDYNAAIVEGEKMMALSGGSAVYLDELYYILGLSYMKTGNYLRASDIFEIIIKEFPSSRFRQEAGIGAGDSYFLMQDYSKAEKCYNQVSEKNTPDSLLNLVYYRLGQCALKKGETEKAKEYLDKVNPDYPVSPEMKLNEERRVLVYYTVQVGSFSNFANANNLSKRLTQKGYQAYIEEIKTENRHIYKVRVGKLKTRQEAVELEGKLQAEGYPTRIIP